MKWLLLLSSEVMILRQDAVCIGYETYGWWKSVWFGEKHFGNNGEVVEKGEKEPTACVLMCRRGAEVDLERVRGSGI